MGDIQDIGALYDEYEETSKGLLFIEPYGVLTTADEVRAVFGLSEAELPTDMLTQSLYAKEVSAGLSAIEPEMQTLWSERQADAGFVGTVGTFALYCVANKICDVLPLIVARTLTDSKSTFQRFDIDLQAVISGIRSRYAQAIQALKDAIAKTQTKKLVLPALFGSGKPVYDPVLGR